VRTIVGVILGTVLVLAAAEAWALSTADSGALWIPAPAQQKTQVVNILSRQLSVEPAKLQDCLTQFFSKTENAGTSIQEAAKQCKEQDKK